MGGTASTNVSTSLFKSDELEKLRKRFVEFDSALFSHPLFPSLDSQVKVYFNKYLKSRKDFCSFVGVLEYIIYGKSVNIDVFNSNSLIILIEILKLGEGVVDQLPDYLISMSEANPVLKDYIKLTSNQPKWISDYFEHHFPLLGSAFARFVKFKLLGTGLGQPPKVELEERLVSEVIDLLFYSTFNLQSSASVLFPLFLSDRDGFSFIKLAQAIGGYHGSMILVIKIDEGGIIGAHIGEDLRDNATTSGSMDTFLFSLVGGFKTFKPEYGNMQGKYMYLNSKISKSSKFPKGLGFGGSKEDARLWLDNNLDQDSYVSDSCGTYESGQLIQSQGHAVPITIITIEIWGCGGDRALETQQKLKKSDEVRVTNARKIDKTQFANNTFNRENLLSNTFQNSQYKRD